MSEQIIELEHIHFNYGNKIVLQDINLTVKPGDFLGIIGPNGSGKSTLLKIIVGLLRPSGGSVKIFGVEKERFHEWTRVGFVGQRVTAFNHAFPATVKEIVLSGLSASLGLFRRFGMKEKEMVDEALGYVGALDLKEQPIGELSGGQQQRVFLARALVSKPELLILDEPTVGVDVETKGRFLDLLSKLRKQHGITLLIVSHDTEVVTVRVETVACLDKKLHFHGSPRDYWADHTSGYALQLKENSIQEI